MLALTSRWSTALKELVGLCAPPLMRCAQRIGLSSPPWASFKAHPRITTPHFTSTLRVCRFAGLTLAARIPQRGGYTAEEHAELCGQIHAAAWPFMRRLLMPLRNPGSIALVQEQSRLEQQLLGAPALQTCHASCSWLLDHRSVYSRTRNVEMSLDCAKWLPKYAGASVALAVLAATTAAPAVAASEDLHELLPALCRLLRAQSLAHACEVPAVPVDPDSSSQADEGACMLLANLLTHSDVARQAAVEMSMLECLDTWLHSRLGRATAAALRSAMAAMLAVCRPLQPLHSGGAQQPPSENGCHARDNASDTDAAFAAEALCIAGSLADLAAADLRATGDNGAAADDAEDVNRQRARLAEAQEVQSEALQALALVVPELCSSAVVRAVVATGAWRLRAIDAAVRVLQSKGHVPDCTFEAALHILNTIAACFGPLALLRMPTAATPLAQVDAQYATMPVLLVSQVVRLEVFCYLQAAALQRSSNTPAAGVRQRSFRAIELCIDLHEALLQLLMTDSLEDFAAGSSGGEIDPCEQAGHELMAAAVLSDEVTMQVRADQLFSLSFSPRRLGDKAGGAEGCELAFGDGLHVIAIARNYNRILELSRDSGQDEADRFCVSTCRCTRQCRNC